MNTFIEQELGLEPKNGCGVELRHPIESVRKRNRTIRTMIVAVALAITAAVFVCLAPEIGLLAAATGSLLASTGSAALTIVARQC